MTEFNVLYNTLAGLKANILHPRSQEALIAAGKLFDGTLVRVF